MKIVRSLFAVVIALSVAILPAVGGAALAAASTTAMTSNDANPMPCDKMTPDCNVIAACAFKCFNFVSTDDANLVPLLATFKKQCPVAKHSVPLLPHAPPSPPPRL